MPSQRSGSRSWRAARTCPIVCAANRSPPPGLSRISRASSSWRRAHGTTWSPGCVSRGFGRRTSIWDLLSSKRDECLAGEAVHRPVGVRARPEALIESDRVAVPIEHRPLETAATAIHRKPSEVLEHGAADAAAPLLGDNEQVLQIDSRPAEERREVVEEQREARRSVLIDGKQNLRVRPVTEQARREQVLRHHHLVLELLVARKPANQLRDYGNVVPGCGANADAHFGRSRSRKTRRMAPWVSEKLAILLSTRPAARPASMTSVSRSALRPPLGRMTQMAPLGSIQVLSSSSFLRPAASSAPTKTRSTFDRGLPVTMSEVRSFSSLMKPTSSRLTIAIFEPGFTPSLSSSGRVDSKSALWRFVTIASATDRTKDHHTNQPCRIRARDGEHDHRDGIVDTAREQEPKGDETRQHQRGDHDSDHSSGDVDGAQT